MPESVQFANQHLKSLMAIVVKQACAQENDHRDCAASLSSAMEYVAYRVSVGDLGCLNAVGVMIDRRASMYLGSHDNVSSVRRAPLSRWCGRMRLLNPAAPFVYGYL